MSATINVGPVYERLLAYTPLVVVNGRQAIELPRSSCSSVLVYLPSDESDGLLESVDHREYGLGDDLPRRHGDLWGRLRRIAIQCVLKGRGRAHHFSSDQISHFSLQRSHLDVCHDNESHTARRGDAE